MIAFAGVDGTGEVLNWQYRETFRNSHVNKLGRGEGLGGKGIWAGEPFYHRGPRLWGQETLLYATKAFASVMYKLKTKRAQSVVLAGYSRGGAAVIEVAYMMQFFGQEVEAMFLFDAVDKSLVVGGPPPNTGPLDWLDPSQWNNFKGRPIPSNVKKVYHAMRHSRTKSRESFGNCGVLLENPSATFYEQKYFDATHGGMGGTPWSKKAVPAGQPYISEGWPDGLTTVMPAEDNRISQCVWTWMLARVEMCLTKPNPGLRIPKPVHTIAAGESLSLIAGKYWNDVLLWPILHDANKVTIGGDPNRILPNRKLVIPDIRKYSPSQLEAARGRGRNWR